ncbi:MAG: response regulator [Verrucomicrobia bacterium]|nr:response regulator [Verrucomicrobiota bacterium]
MSDSVGGNVSLRESLQRLGFIPEWKHVVTEADFRAGLEAPPDVILADFTRGGFSGQRALELLHEHGLDVPLIVIAQGFDEAAIVAGMKMGVADFVNGDRLDRLAAAIQGALTERRQRRAQRQALDALQRNQERLARIVASGTSVTYALESYGNTAKPIWVSENVVTLTGFPVAEALRPEWWWEQLHHEDRPRLTAELARPPDQDQLLLEYRFQVKSGNYVWLRDERTLVRDASGAILEVLGSWSDITDRKNLETQLRQAQKMEAVGQLASGVAHDFNNLLTAIRCQTETVLAYETISAAARDMLLQVVVATERATDLTRQLLAFSRSQPIQQIPLDLNKLVGNLNKMLYRVIGENIKLTLELAPELPPIHADPGMVEQVILNLAVNARDAMSSGGALTFATTVLETDAEYLRRQPNARLGEFVALNVTDTGCGIPADVLPRIFDPFFTTKEVGKGTGLGLATVFGIVQQHQGWIEVETQPGQGAGFRIYFPARRELVSDAATVAGTSEIPGGTETLLVVEDDPDLRELVGLTLQKLGYRVLDAATSGEALRIWEANAPAIKLVLTDAVLTEGMNGWELAARLHAQQPALKLIVMSGYMAETREQALSAGGGIKFLSKPFDPLSLGSLVRKCLDAEPHTPVAQ